MRFIGRTIKYLLRSAFSIIIFLLLVGWAKINRDMNAYISFLNNNDRSVFHWSQVSTWGDPFRPNKQISGDIADILSGDALDPELSGLDVYDPAFEEDLNAFSNLSLSGSEEDYGFTATGQTDTETSSDADSKSSLLDLIKQRELQK